MKKLAIVVLLAVFIAVLCSGCAKEEAQTQITSFKNGEFIVGEGRITAGVYNITPLDMVANVSIWRGNELRVNEIMFFMRDDEIENVKLKNGDRIIARDGEIVFKKPISDD